MDEQHAVAEITEGRRQRAPGALTALLVIATVAALYLARDFVIPVVLALLFKFVLEPPVRAVARAGVPRPAAAALVLVAILGALGGAVYLAAEPIAGWIDDAPRHLDRIEERLQALSGPVEEVGAAAERLDKIVKPDDKVEVDPDGGSLQYLLAQLTDLSATIVVVAILLFMLLGSGDLMLRKLVAAVPRFRDKRSCVEVVRCIERDISTYLLTITVINAVLGTCVGLVMWATGMPNPALWGVMATALNFIPYLGAILGVTIVGLVALVSLDSVAHALLPPLGYLFLTGIEGYVLTPHVVGRRLALEPILILLSILFWGWLWGVTGALIAVPMMAAVKIACDHSERWHAVGTMLGR